MRPLKAGIWRNILAFILPALLFFSCTRDIPSAPKVEFQQAQDSIRLMAGTDSAIYILFSDSTALSQYKLSLITAPGSIRIDTSRTGIAWQEWIYLFIGETSVAELDTSFILSPPVFVQPGKYRLIGAALNHAFLEGSDTVWIFLKNPTDTVKPTINLTSPSPNSAFANSDTIKISGIMEDLASDLSPAGVYQVNVALRNITGGSPVSVYNASRVKNDTLRVNYTVSSGLTDGNYHLVIVMTDGYNNVDSLLVPVVVQ